MTQPVIYSIPICLQMVHKDINLRNNFGCKLQVGSYPAEFIYTGNPKEKLEFTISLMQHER